MKLRTAIILSALQLTLYFVLVIATLPPIKEKQVYLGTSIGEPKKYIDLAKDLDGYEGPIRVHIVGNGGDYEGVVYIMNILSRHDNVTLEVDGTVQSGHAILALSGDKIEIPSKGFFMLHLTSGTNMEKQLCVDEKGLDRGLSANKKCIEDATNTVGIYNNEIIKIYSKVVTAEELERLKQGHNIYITNEDMRSRLNGQSRN